jgi:hypothetical protein
METWEHQIKAVKFVTDSIMKIPNHKTCSIYTEPKLGSRDYECFCLGILSDGFKTKEDAYRWIITKLVEMLDLYVDWDDPDSNLLNQKEK